MIKIAPSILAADFLNLKEEIRKVQQAGADMLHLDIMDGHFVPNLTFGMEITEKIKQCSSIPLDVHLMVTNPQEYFAPLGQMGVEYVSFHPETVYHLHRSIYYLKDLGIKTGAALNPASPVELVEAVLPDLDFLLLMSVNPGFGGQKFLPLTYQKLKKISRLLSEKEHHLEIEVDGGVNNLNAPDLKNNGVDILVAGSFIFGNDDYQKQIESLR
ncbi:MAG: ribulose-phosphate 3-epimerase [Candidatus Cloacimonetes bacterium]|nr:ribulose-phosphate 3-epimerase [Candidatus Cloacimonadota bacterium]